MGERAVELLFVVADGDVIVEWRTVDAAVLSAEMIEVRELRKDIVEVRQDDQENIQQEGGCEDSGGQGQDTSSLRDAFVEKRCIGWRFRL